MSTPASIVVVTETRSISLGSGGDRSQPTVQRLGGWVELPADLAAVLVVALQAELSQRPEDDLLAGLAAIGGRQRDRVVGGGHGEGDPERLDVTAGAGVERF